MNDELLDSMRDVSRKLSALLAISVDQHLRSTSDFAKPRPRSMDRMLSDAGLKGSEIAAILGKTPQAVSQALAADGKAKKRPARRKSDAAGPVTRISETAASAGQNYVEE